MAAISDAILNFTPSARDPDCPPKFFYLSRGVLPESRVKIRGHLIAHGGLLTLSGSAGGLIGYVRSNVGQFEQQL